MSRIVEVHEVHLMTGLVFVVEWWEDGPTTNPHSFRRFAAEGGTDGMLGATRGVTEEEARAGAEEYAAMLRKEANP